MSAENKRNPVDKEALALEREMIGPTIKALDEENLNTSFMRAVEGLDSLDFDREKTSHQTRLRALKEGEARVSLLTDRSFVEDFTEAETLVGYQDNFKELAGRKGVIPIYLNSAGNDGHILYGMALPTGGDETAEEIIALKDGLFTVAPANSDNPVVENYRRAFKGGTTNISASLHPSLMVIREYRHGVIQSRLRAIGIETSEKGDTLKGLANLARSYKQALNNLGTK